MMGGESTKKDGNQDYKIEALHLVDMVIGKSSLKKSEEVDSGERERERRVFEAKTPR